MTTVATAPARETRLGIVKKMSAGSALALLSYLIYAYLALTLPQGVDNPFICERSSLAAAVSNVAFGMRLGTLDSEVMAYYLKTMDEPLRELLDETAAAAPRYQDAPLPGSVVKTTQDGNGAGYLLVLTVAFHLFGLHVWALPLMMLALMGVSALALRRRFSDWSASIIILYFTILTVLMFSPLVWNPNYARNMPIGGIRYFSLVTILPTFHMLLELFGPEMQPARRRNLWLLGVQAAILVVGAMVRGSAIPLLGAIGLVWLVLAVRYRRVAARRWLLVRQALTVGLTGLVIVGVMAASLPREYLTEGRFGTVIWHRITLSLGVDESFPWPGVAELFDCKKYIPEGIQPGMPDTNGHCIWLDYVVKHHIPLGSIGDKTYGGLYDVSLRDAFFEIARMYPGKVLTAFVYYKPRWIVQAIAATLRTNFAGDPARTVDHTVHFPERGVIPYSPVAVGLLIAALATCLLNFFVGARASLPTIRRVAGVAALGIAFTIPSYIAVWALPYTTADLLFYLLFCIGFAAGSGVMSARWALDRLISAQAVRGA